MGANKSKLIESISAMSRSKFKDLSIQHILEADIPYLEIQNSPLYDSLLKDTSMEDYIQQSSQRNSEVFKRNSLMNFLDSEMAKDCANVLTHHVHEKFLFDFSNPAQNEYSTQIAHTCGFFLSVFLQKATSEIEKEEILQKMTELKQFFLDDHEAQQKFFTVNNIIKDVIYSIEQEHNLEKVFTYWDKCYEHLRKYLSNSNYPLFFIKDILAVLSRTIVDYIINSPKSEPEVKVKGMLMLFQCGICFGNLDFYLEFARQMLKEENQKLVSNSNDFVSLFQILCKKLFILKREYDFEDSSKEVISIDYNGSVPYTSQICGTTDGDYLYIKSSGLYKIGTGRNNTIKSRIYQQNTEFTTEGQIVYSNGALLIKLKEPNTYQSIDIETLKEGEKFQVKSTTMVTTRDGLNFKYDEEKIQSVISDGKLIYEIVSVGEVSKESYSQFGGKVYFEIRVLKSNETGIEHFCSYPLVDSKRKIPRGDEFFSDFAATDGRVIYFFDMKAKLVYVFNTLFKHITAVEDIEYSPIFFHCFDTFSSCGWKFSQKDSNGVQIVELEKLKIQENNIHTPVNIFKDNTHFFTQLGRFISETDTITRDYSEKAYSFVVGLEKIKTINTATAIEPKEIVSLLFSALALSCDYRIDIRDYEKLTSFDMLFKRIFDNHILNLNENTLHLLFFLLKTYQHPGILKLINYHLLNAKKLKVALLTQDIQEYSTWVLDKLEEILLENNNNECKYSSSQMTGILNECVVFLITFGPELEKEENIVKLLKILHLGGELVEEAVLRILLNMNLCIPKNKKLIEEMLEVMLNDNENKLMKVIQEQQSEGTLQTLHHEAFELIFMRHLKTVMGLFIESQSKVEKKPEFTEHLELFISLFTIVHKSFSQLVHVFNSNRSVILQRFSYAYRLYYSFLHLLYFLLRDNIIGFKVWKMLLENLILLSNLPQFPEQSKKKEFCVYIETPVKYPSEEVSVEETYTFETPDTITFEFNPLCVFPDKDPAKFSLLVLFSNGKTTELHKEDLRAKKSFAFSNVNKIEIKVHFPANQQYWIRLLVHNSDRICYNLGNETRHPTFGPHLKLLTSLTSSIINSFFFYTKQEDSKTNKKRHVGEILQSKLFSGGIPGSADAIQSMEDLALFNSHGEFTELFPQQEEVADDFEKCQPVCSFDQIISKSIPYLEKLITRFQAAGKKNPWLTQGGEKGELIVRSVFAVLMKQEERLNEICLNDEEIHPCDDLLFIWNEVSKLRIWYKEQIKDLAEVNKESEFESQNENFVRSVVDKCRFLFSLNPPKRKKISSIIRRKSSDIFERSLSAQKRVNEDSLRKTIHSINQVVKSSDITVENLLTAMKAINTNTYFREISMVLLNYIFIKIKDHNIKIYILKELVNKLRLISGKKTVSVYHGLKSATPKLLYNLTQVFHLLFSNILEALTDCSNSYYLYAGYLDCLMFNIKARNHKMLADTLFIDRVFGESSILKDMWNATESNKKSVYLFNDVYLGRQIMEAFEIYSTIILNRVVAEPIGSENEENSPELGLAKEKSSIFDVSCFESLLYEIFVIISEKISDYVRISKSKYNDPKIIPAKDFAKEIYDEDYLHVFLLLIYKFIANRSIIVIKEMYMKFPELFAEMLVILPWTSPKNQHILCSILEVILSSFPSEGISNIVMLLAKTSSLFTIEGTPENSILNYIFNVIYRLRKGLFSLKSLSLSSEFEESYHLLGLIRALANYDSWKKSLLVMLEQKLDTHPLDYPSLSISLSILFGDLNDFYYGCPVATKIDKTSAKYKPLNQKFIEKVDESQDYIRGYIIGFLSREISLSSLKNDSDYKEKFIDEIKYERLSGNSVNSYAVIALISQESFNSARLKNNQLELLVKNTNDLIILNKEKDYEIFSPLLGKRLLILYTEYLEKLSILSQVTYLDMFIFIQLCKTISWVIKHYSSQVEEYFKDTILSRANIEKLQKILSCPSQEHSYKNISLMQLELSNVIKIYLNAKSILPVKFNECIQKDINGNFIICTALKTQRSLKFMMKKQESRMKVINILSSSININDNAFLKIKKLKFEMFSTDTHHVNQVVYADLSQISPDVVAAHVENSVLIFTREDKEKIPTSPCAQLPYLVLNTDKETLMKCLNTITSEEVATEELVEQELRAKIMAMIRKNETEGGLKKYLMISGSNPVNSLESLRMLHGNFKTGVTEESLFNVLNTMCRNYMRIIFIDSLAVDSCFHFTENTNILNFAFDQFKVAFYDACQQSLLIVFKYDKFEKLTSLLWKILTASKECNKQLIDLNLESKLFTSLSLGFNENLIQESIQYELVELYFDFINSSNSISAVERMTSLLTLMKKSINVDTYIFNGYSNKFIDELDNYAKATDCEVLQESLKSLMSNGIQELLEYLEICLKEEEIPSSRTNVLIDFVYRINLISLASAKKVISEILPLEKTHQFIDNLSTLALKIKNPSLKSAMIFEQPEAKALLRGEISITCPEHLAFEIKCTNRKSKATSYSISSTMNKKDSLLVSADYIEDRLRVKTLMSGEYDSIYHYTTDPNRKLFLTSRKNVEDELFMCGQNSNGKLGNDILPVGNYIYIPYQCQLDDNIRIRKVLLGSTFTLAWTWDNKIYACGEGVVSGLSNNAPNFTASNKWNKLPRENIMDMDIGYDMSIIMVTDRSIYAHGPNTCYKFTDVFNSTSSPDDIIKITAPFKTSSVVQVSLGVYHTLYLLADGSVWGSGCNQCKELNDDQLEQQKKIIKVKLNNLKCKKAIAAGHGSLFLLKSDNDDYYKLYSCGSSSSGVCGQGMVNESTFLSKCKGVESIEFFDINAADSSACAVSKDHTLYTWGANDYHQLSHSDNARKYQPTLVDAFNGMTVLQADINNNNLVVRCIEGSKTKVYTAGYNSYGCMGIGDFIETNNHIPIEVTTFDGDFISQVSCSKSTSSVAFVKTNVSDLSRPFEFKCEFCNVMQNAMVDTCFIVRFDVLKKNAVVCRKCFNGELIADNVGFAVRGLSVMKTNLLKYSECPLNDLSVINSIETSTVHTTKCSECAQEISNQPAYVHITDTDGLPSQSMEIFCEMCYTTRPLFNLPTIVYCIKKPFACCGYSSLVDLLPMINSENLIYTPVDQDKPAHDMKIKTYCKLDPQALNEIIQANKELVNRVNRVFDEITLEHLLQYNACYEEWSAEITGDDQKIMDNLKKVDMFSLLSKEQLEIIIFMNNKIINAVDFLRTKIDIEENSAIKKLYSSNLMYLSKRGRREIVDKLLHETCTGISYDQLSARISRGRASKFKTKSQIDTTGSYLIVWQLAEQLKRLEPSQYKARPGDRLFRVYLVGEGATDAGGPFRDVIDAICEELHEPYQDLFIPTPNNRSGTGTDRERWTINPSAKMPFQLEMFKILGRLFGFAMRSEHYLNLNLSSFIWKLMLDQKIEFVDFERMDVQMASFLHSLIKKQEESEFNLTFDQFFTTVLSNGTEVELTVGGKNKKLEYSNREEYYSLALEKRFEECREQIEALKTGFYEVIPKSVSIYLGWKDLDERICGNQIFDLALLKRNTNYSGYSENSEVIQWFWKALERFTNEEKQLYLRYVWGRSRLPLNDSGFIHHRHTIESYYSDHMDISLPHAHTCYFTIDLPEYSSCEILYSKLLYAIKFCTAIDEDYTAREALEV